MWRMCNAHVGLKTGLFVFNRLPTKLTKPLQKFLFVISNGLMPEVESYFYNGELNLYVLLFTQWVTNIVTFLRSSPSMRGKLLPIFHDDFQADRPQVMLKVSLLQFHLLTIISFLFL